MSQTVNCLIRRTQPNAIIGVYRILLGLIFVFFGSVKLVFQEIHNSWALMLSEINIPFYDLALIMVPLLQISIGTLLIAGIYSRIGALMVIPIVILPMYAHLTIHNSNAYIFESFELFLPAPLIMMAISVLIYGSGKWSLDVKCFPNDDLIA